MIPSTGWLRNVDIFDPDFGKLILTNQPPRPTKLPQPLRFLYGDGRQDFPDQKTDKINAFDFRLLTVGNVSAVMFAELRSFGWGFKFFIEQFEAYGVGLLDMIAPEVIDDIEPCPPIGTLEDDIKFKSDLTSIIGCCGVVGTEGWIFNGDVFFDGSRTFGDVI